MNERKKNFFLNKFEHRYEYANYTTKLDSYFVFVVVILVVVVVVVLMMMRV